MVRCCGPETAYGASLGAMPLNQRMQLPHSDSVWCCSKSVWGYGTERAYGPTEKAYGATVLRERMWYSGALPSTFSSTAKSGSAAP
eukprot:359556-Rhodomonas_salina.1